jgi:hypothetical protein
MKKPSKTAAELEASIKVEMEDICDWPTDMTISVQPNGDSWKVKVVQEGSVDDADRREMVEQIAARLKGEYDLKGWGKRPFLARGLGLDAYWLPVPGQESVEGLGGMTVGHALQDV